MTLNAYGSKKNTISTEEVTDTGFDFVLLA
jgi:hypothetical protein